MVMDLAVCSGSAARSQTGEMHKRAMASSKRRQFMARECTRFGRKVARRRATHRPHSVINTGRPLKAPQGRQFSPDANCRLASRIAYNGCGFAHFAKNDVGLSPGEFIISRYDDVEDKGLLIRFVVVLLRTSLERTKNIVCRIFAAGPGGVRATARYGDGPERRAFALCRCHSSAKRQDPRPRKHDSVRKCRPPPSLASRLQSP